MMQREELPLLRFHCACGQCWETNSESRNDDRDDRCPECGKIGKSGWPKHLTGLDHDVAPSNARSA
jgi:hypothetical protein